MLEDRASNQQEAQTMIRQAAALGAQIICLPELFSTQYFAHEENHQYFDWAEPVPGPSTQLFSQLAQELEVVLILPLFEKLAPGIYYNTAAILDADGLFLGKYRKNHIPDDPGFYEKFYFTPGEGHYPVFSTRYAKIGVLICWDQWFPEAARLSALSGAEILFYPSAIGWDLAETPEVHQEEYQAWQVMHRSHAIANGIPVAALNRVGQEAGTQFWGGSFVSNAMGRVLFQAPHTQANLEVLPLDLRDTEKYRRIWPFLRDRRIDTYEGLSQRYLGN